MYKIPTEEPKGSFFIGVERSGEFRPSDQGERNFGLNQSPPKLLSLTDMTPFHLAWKRILDHTFDDIQKLTPSQHEKMMTAIYTLRAYIPPEFKRSTKKLKQFSVLVEYETVFKKYLLNNKKKAEELRAAVREESEETTFLCLSETERDRYRNKEQFGAKAPKKFKQIAGDIDEAYKCIALQRNTACVFHCMRMLEFGVHKLARHFKIPLQVDVHDKRTGQPTGEKRDQEWNALCQQILKKIKHMPASTEKRQDKKLLFEDLAIHLSNVREERNRVMHAHYATTKRFSGTKAANVLEETKEFMEGLALLLP